MIYTLYLWTVIAVAGDHHGVSYKAMDWRPIGEYSEPNYCESAARQLGLKQENYRCVRSK